MDGMERTRTERLEMKDSAEMEGARRATGISAGGGEVGEVPSPEVVEKARRRHFSPEYKLRVVREADACRGDGQLGALLRREGLYSSHLTTWRRQRETGALAGMRARKRGPKGREEDPRVKQQAREIARLQRELKQAVTIIDIQKKVAGILGIPLNAPEFEEND
jgi:transposase-like protein